MSYIVTTVDVDTIDGLDPEIRRVGYRSEVTDTITNEAASFFGDTKKACIGSVKVWIADRETDDRQVVDKSIELTVPA